MTNCKIKKINKERHFVFHNIRRHEIEEPELLLVLVNIVSNHDVLHWAKVSPFPGQHQHKPPCP
jgi:hypothetical protein